MAKYNNIIGKRSLEVNERPEQLTLIFEGGEYLMVYEKMVNFILRVQIQN
jgi:hypothetical protein